MELCVCGKNLNLMKKNEHNLKQHLKKCGVPIEQVLKNSKPITNYFSKQSKLTFKYV